MKIFKTVEDLIITAIGDERNNFFASANPTLQTHIDLEDAEQYRYIFIDDNNCDQRIGISQYKMKKPLDTVDVLEALRYNKLLPENNIGKATLQEAIDYHSTGKEEHPLLRSFFEWNKKLDHQIIAHRDHHHQGVILLFKISNDEFVMANFIVTIA